MPLVAARRSPGSLQKMNERFGIERPLQLCAGVDTAEQGYTIGQVRLPSHVYQLNLQAMLDQRHKSVFSLFAGWVVEDDQ